MCGLIVVLAGVTELRAADPTPGEVRAGLLRAVEFFHTKVAVHGGYVWRVSSDLQRREGEARTGLTTIWVQPPATPTVGLAFLDAYAATGDDTCLAAARDAGLALAQGQLHSGGWTYHVEFDPEKRKADAYRDLPLRKKAYNRTTLDDDTTQAALRFLMKLDQALKFKDPQIHETVEYGLGKVLKAQHANGGWSVWWDQTLETRNPADFPVTPAGFPETWSWTWTKDFKGCYVLNDDLMEDIVDMLFTAHDVYGDPKYLAAAERAGDFLILAQLPEPQPAWAQQYDSRMHPSWSRKFEPPAVTGGESQGVMRTLVRLAQRTGKTRYLEPIPRGIAYLRKSQLPDGRLARFYELKTNKPLYFTKDDYQLTHDDSNMPTHYSFKVGSKLDQIERELQEARQPPKKPKGPSKPSQTQKDEAHRILAALDSRGAWVEEGKLKSDTGPVEKRVIQSETFAANVAKLSNLLRASGAK